MQEMGCPNRCFHIEHCNSEAVKRDPTTNTMLEKADQKYEVCGNEYRVTNAEHTIGINAESGAIYGKERHWTTNFPRSGA